MKLTTRAKSVVGAVALAGAVVLTGGAFTAGGLTTDAGAVDDRFVGGSVEQSFIGANIASVEYGVNEANNTIESVTLTFSDDSADGRTPDVVFTGGTVQGTFTCDEVDVVDHESTCTGAPAASNNVTSVTVTVNS